MRIPLPDQETQAALVAEADARLSVIQAVDDEVALQVARVASLRNAILRRAFSGQLVSQAPNDAPASVLLERIRAERAAAPVRPRSKKGRKAAR